MRRVCSFLALCGAAVCTLSSGASSLQAQTVRPAVVELPATPAKVVSGSFEVVNDGLEPLVVTLQPRSFTIDRDGRPLYRPLDAAVHLELSATSLRLPAKQSRQVLYRVSADAFPACLTIYAGFMTTGRTAGVRVQLDMPHTVYLLSPAKVDRSQVRLVALRQQGHTVVGTVQNHSATLVRLLSLDTSGPAGRTSAGGFPVLPGAERDFVLEAERATTVRARFSGYDVSAAVPPGQP